MSCPIGDVQRLNWLALAMLAIPLISGLLQVVQRRFSAKAGEGIIYDLRVEHVLSPAEHVAALLHQYPCRRDRLALQQRCGRRAKRDYRHDPDHCHERRHVGLHAGGYDHH